MLPPSDRSEQFWLEPHLGQIHCYNAIAHAGSLMMRGCCLNMIDCWNCKHTLANHDFKSLKCLFGPLFLDMHHLIKANWFPKEIAALREALKTIPERP